MKHIDLASLVLAKGSHTAREHGVCFLEAVAWFAGRSHTDAPQCVSPVLRAFGILFNDVLLDDERQALVPYIPRLIGTAGDAALDERRGWMAADWLIRVCVPAWLRLAGLGEHAERLASAEEIVSAEAAARIQPVLDAAARAAWAAEAARAAEAAEAAGAAWAARAARAAGAAEAAGAARAAWAARAARAAWAAGAAGAARAAEAAEAAGAAEVAWAARAARAAEAAEAAGAAGDAGDAWKPTVEELKRSAWELWERMVAASSGGK